MRTFETISLASYNDIVVGSGIHHIDHIQILDFCKNHIKMLFLIFVIMRFLVFSKKAIF